jgi:RNA polymerase primary sigma factor
VRRTPSNRSLNGKRINGAAKNGTAKNGASKNGNRSAAFEPDHHGDDHQFLTDDDIEIHGDEPAEAEHDELDHLPEDGSAESHIDDPIRMYLMQMGEIPMLSRPDEIASARRIEITRRRFRNLMLGNDFVLQAAVDLLEKVGQGELRLDRTIEISVTNTAEKKRTLKRLPPNLATIKHLLRLNQKDFRIAVDKKRPSAEKHAAWRRLVVRRNKAVRLVEELNLRLGRLLPIMHQLHKISERMANIKQQLTEPEKLLSERQHQELLRELRYLMRITLETPATLASLVARTNLQRQRYDEAKRVLSAANLRLVVSIA